MNAYDIEIEYDEENENYYAEHEFAYPSKRVRLNIDTDNSLWPTDESNSITITIPSNPQTDANNTWDDTTKTLTLTNLDQNTLITNNQNPTFNYATDLNINLSNYQSTNNTKINIKSISTSNNSSTKIPLSSLTKSNNNQTLTLNSNNAFFKIHINPPNYNIYYIRSGSSSKSVYVNNGDYYYFFNSNYYYIYLFDENNEMILQLNDDNNGDNIENYIVLSNSKFNLIFD